jgi:hypothetical protein
LRDLAARADLVVLHVDPDDVVPLLALAGSRPPTMFVDHADHVFWLGTTISDLLISLRSSGQRLAIERRGISRQRAFLLPTIVEPATAVMTSAEARASLGIAADTIAVVSVARSIKFGSVDGVSYPAAHVPVMTARPSSRLLAVGARADASWLRAGELTSGRIRALGARHDAQRFYAAADIYVDSFPFVSVTSLLEAATHGLPLVTLCPYVGTAGVFCADAPGLDRGLIRTANVQDYQTALLQLIDDAPARHRLGSFAKDDVLAAHTGERWQAALERAYARAIRPAGGDVEAVPTALGSISEVDLRWNEVFGRASGLEESLQTPLRELPLSLRLGALSRGALRGKLNLRLLLSDSMAAKSRWVLAAFRRAVARH